MTEERWTELMIEERLVEAADVMKRLPNVRVPGHFNTWPAAMREFSDLVGQETPGPTRLRPNAEAIGRMEETLEWLKFLEPIDRKLIWLRASGQRWKTVCGKVGLQRAAAHEHWLYALCVIAWRLNGRHVPKAMSKRRFIERTIAATA
jgi:hypothetical protein